MVVRETLNGFQDGLQTGGRIVTNLSYNDDIILLPTSEAELQQLVDRLDRVYRKYRRQQEKGNGERRYSMPHTHSE